MFFLGKGFSSFGSSSSLLDGLISYWKLDEASGTAVDSTGTNDLTAVNNPVATTGKIGNARQFVSASNQYLEVADNPSLNLQTITWAGWVNLTTLALATIAGKAAVGLYEWFLRYYSSTGRFQLLAAPNNVNLYTASADNFGAPSAGVWYFIVCHVNSAGLVSISINNGAANTTAMGGPMVSNTAKFRLGSRSDDVGKMNGVVDEAGLWNRELTAAEITSLYNSGNGLTHPFL